MTIDPIMIGVGIAIAVVALIVVIVLLLAGRRAPRKEDSPGLTTSLQNLTQTIQLGQAQMNILTEKVNRLDPMIKTLGSLDEDFKELTERISKVERSQIQATQGLGAIAAGLAQSESTLVSKVDKAQEESTQSLQQVGHDLSGELARIQTELATLQSNVQARQENEQRTAESMRRLETIVASARANGSAGENILDVMLAKLPVDWQVRNFGMNGKQIEFGLRLPNRQILPIDSQWTSGAVLEQFMAARDMDEQRRLKVEIENVILHKAREIGKSIDPSVTVAFGIVLVPDSVYDLCGAVRAEVFQTNVAVVSYSLFVPYLLLVLQTILKAGPNVDLQKWDAHLRALQDSITRLQEEVDGRFREAMNVLAHARDDMRDQLNKVGAGITGLQVHTAMTSTQPALAEYESLRIE